jgi:hypothetical protein
LGAQDEADLFRFTNLTLDWNYPASTDTFSLRCRALFHSILLKVHRALVA